MFTVKVECLKYL